jgi:hypothetical protein
VACDELAVRVTGARVAQYGAMLMQTAVTGPYAGNLFAAGISERYSNLRWRLVAMKHFSPKKPTWRSGAVCLLLAVFLLVPWALTSRPPVPESPNMQQLRKLQQTAGVTALSGPGVVIELSDRPRSPKTDSSFPPGVGPGLVHDFDLLALVNELRATDAEGIAVNGIRLGNSTAIRCVGPSIFVGKQPIAAPFRIAAIGDAQRIQKFLTKRGSFFYQMKTEKEFMPNVKLTRAAQLHLPAVKQTTTFRFAKSM